MELENDKLKQMQVELLGTFENEKEVLFQLKDHKGELEDKLEHNQLRIRQLKTDEFNAK